MSYETLCKKILAAISEEFPFDLNFEQEYFSPKMSWRTSRRTCILCEGAGAVELKGRTYTCPRCGGKPKEHEIVAEGSVWKTGEFKLSHISMDSDRISIVLSGCDESARFTFRKGKSEPYHQDAALGLTENELPVSTDKKDIQIVVRKKNKAFNDAFAADKKQWEENNGKV